MKKGILANALACVCMALTLGACNPAIPEEEIVVYMPDGAPALALAKLMHEDKADDGVSYKVVNAELIASKVTNQEESKNADLCIMPLTAASKLLGNGERYTMLGTVTHGNLYLLSNTDEEITADNLSSLVGKKVGVLQINNVPGLTLKTVLNKYQIPWQELTNEGSMAEDKVNLVAINGPDAVGTIQADYFIIAEPAASAQAKKNYRIVGDLQRLYGGENGYPQAVLVAKNEFVNEYSAWTKSFVEKLAIGSEWLFTASADTLVNAVATHMEDPGVQTSLKAPMLSETVIRGCGIRFTYAASDYQTINQFLTEMISVNDKSAAMPAQSFYWNYTK